MKGVTLWPLTEVVASWVSSVPVLVARVPGWPSKSSNLDWNPKKRLGETQWNWRVVIDARVLWRVLWRVKSSLYFFLVWLACNIVAYFFGSVPAPLQTSQSLLREHESLVWMFLSSEEYCKHFVIFGISHRKWSAFQGIQMAGRLEKLWKRSSAASGLFKRTRSLEHGEMGTTTTDYTILVKWLQSFLCWWLFIASHPTWCRISATAFRHFGFRAIDLTSSEFPSNSPLLSLPCFFFFDFGFSAVTNMAGCG